MRKSLQPKLGVSLLSAAMESINDNRDIHEEVLKHEPLMEFAATSPKAVTSTVLRAGAAVNVITNSFLSVKTDTETGDITITGSWVWMMMRDIYNEWRTIKIEQNMFKEVKLFSATIDSFFAVELLFIFERLSESKKTNQLKYAKLSALLYKNSWLSEAADNDPLKINFSAIAKELKLTLLPVQVNYLNRYAEAVPALNLRGNVLGSAPGSGKTIAGLAWGLAFDIDILVLIVPKNSIHEVWEDTIINVFHKPRKYWISSGSKGITGKEDYIICHYEAIDEVLKVVRKFKGNVGVWVDECHNFNEESSLRTQKLVGLCKDPAVSHVTWASGTPLKAMAREASAMLSALVPNYTAEVAERFKKSLARSSSVGELVRHRLSYTVYSVPKHEVVQNKVEYVTWPVTFKGMERFTLSNVKVAMDKYITERVEYYKKWGPALVAEYIDILRHYEAGLDKADKVAFDNYVEIVKSLHTSFNQWTDGDIVIIAKRYEKEFIEPTLTGDILKAFRKNSSIYKYPALVIRGEALGHVLTAERVACFSEIAKHAGLVEIVKSARKKTVIFSSYVDTVDVAAGVCVKGKLKPIIVHGTAESSLDEAVGKFRKSKDINPIVATYKSLSTAVPLIEASTLVLVNHPYRDYEWQQATARVDRLGQDGEVLIIDLILDTGDEPNLSTRGKDIMSWSKEATDFLLGDTFIEINSTSEL